MPLKSTLSAAVLVAALAMGPSPAFAETTKELVVRAVTELFGQGDLSALDRYWAEDYIQHNPGLASGRDTLKQALADMPENMTYEIGMVITEGNLVAIHGRYSGWGPKPMIAVDIYRVEDGKIKEHWDVLQEEVLETASGNPMFSAPN